MEGAILRAVVWSLLAFQVLSFARVFTSRQDRIRRESVGRRKHDRSVVSVRPCRLASLRHLERDQFKCIVFDESHHFAVVNNKSFSQAGKNIMELAQSKCGARQMPSAYNSSFQHVRIDKRPRERKGWSSTKTRIGSGPYYVGNFGKGERHASSARFFAVRNNTRGAGA